MIDDLEKPKWRVSKTLRGRAKTLRRDMTDAERIVWYGLRPHRLHGAGFRRQMPIGPYVVDFACRAAKLIVEVDGGQHFEPEHIANDERRSAFLAAQGYRMLRFTNLDVLKNKSGVLETIAAALGKSESPLPNPPPQAGEGTAPGAGEATVTQAGERTDIGSVSALRSPSPACGGGSGRGRATEDSAS